MSERRLTGAELEASRWIARLEASDVTLEDHQRFRAWLDQAPENRPAYDAVSRTWDKLDSLKLLSSSPPAAARSGAPPSRRALLLGGAGAAVAAGGAAAVFWALTPATTFAATYETNTGGRQLAALSDGSQIELNAETRVRIAYTDEARHADLERGEALFRIVEDGRPFEVRTPFGSITAANAIVLVKVRDASVRTTIVAGRASARSSSSSPVEASANRELILSRRPLAQEAVSPERAARRLAWREHMLAFDGETLAEAAADVTRQTGVRFRFASDEVAALRVGGYIDGRDADAFVSLIETNLALSVERQSDGTFLTGE